MDVNKHTHFDTVPARAVVLPSPDDRHCGHARAGACEPGQHTGLKSNVDESLGYDPLLRLPCNYSYPVATGQEFNFFGQPAF